MSSNVVVNDLFGEAGSCFQKKKKRNKRREKKKTSKYWFSTPEQLLELYAITVLKSSQTPGGCTSTHADQYSYNVSWPFFIYYGSMQ